MGYGLRDFNPRSPRGGATVPPPTPNVPSKISIHAPHEGERRCSKSNMLAFGLFQSTLPTRGSDIGDAYVWGAQGISIHAPHEGERRQYFRSYLLECYFNPRSPRGGATAIDAQAAQESKISIHAPHEGERPQGLGATMHEFVFQSTLPTRGSDHRYGTSRPPYTDFNPRSPRGGATVKEKIFSICQAFQSTLPTRGSDWLRQHAEAARSIFQSTLPTRGSDGGKVHLYAAFPRIY